MAADTNELEEGTALAVNFGKRGGFVPAIVQDARDGRVLMIAYVNGPALDETLASGMATFWSTSRNELWKKGATSGNFLKIVEVLVDCDQDALLYRVEPQGAGACHTKDPRTGAARPSCFYRKIERDGKSLTRHAP